MDSKRVIGRVAASVLGVALFTSVMWAQTRTYVIGPEDVLVVTVFNQPDFTGHFAVGADGTFAYPLLGRVKAAGLTTRDIETQLTTSLSGGGLLKHPEVTVSIDVFKSQQVFVMGEVRNPGPLYLSGPETLIQALARSGSTTADAGSEVLIVRPRQRGTTVGPLRPDRVDANEVLHVDLEALSTGALDQDVVLQNGDTVFVPRAESVYILGQVKNPGAYRMSKPITVLQLLSMAGGVTDRGAVNRIKITRVVNGKKQEIPVKTSEILKPNDTVTVPTKYF